MPEDPVAHHGLAPLTRRLGQKADRLEAGLEDLEQRLDRHQAQIVELLTGRTEPRIVAAPVSTTWSEAA